MAGILPLWRELEGIVFTHVVTVLVVKELQIEQFNLVYRIGESTACWKGIIFFSKYQQMMCINRSMK